MIKTKFNKNNIGAHVGYPLFLGPSLGIIDTINVNYPVLEELYQIQASQQWSEFEVDLTQDRMDMLEVSQGTKDLMVKTLMFQTASDSVAARSIASTLGPHVSNSELENLLTVWSYFEVIHSRTYSHIIKQTFTDSNHMIEQLYAEAAVMNRIDIVTQVFDTMSSMDPELHDVLEFQCAIIKTLTALFAMEMISFMSSFAVTFSITETGVFQGIGQLVKLICRDEILHGRMSHEIISILKKDSGWSEAFEMTRPDRAHILESVVRQELDWADYLFTEGRKVVGLNASLLKDYTCYVAAPVYRALDCNINFEVPKVNPLPYMDSYIDTTKVQSAAQEIQLTNYNIGSIVDDTDGLDLGDL